MHRVRALRAAFACALLAQMVRGKSPRQLHSLRRRYTPPVRLHQQKWSRRHAVERSAGFRTMLVLCPMVLVTTCILATSVRSGAEGVNRAARTIPTPASPCAKSAVHLVRGASVPASDLVAIDFLNTVEGVALGKGPPYAPLQLSGRPERRGIERGNFPSAIGLALQGQVLVVLASGHQTAHPSGRGGTCRSYGVHLKPHHFETMHFG